MPLQFLVVAALGLLFGAALILRERLKPGSAGEKKPASARDFLGIEKVRDGLIYLPGGGVRAVIECGAVNYALMSEEEQDRVEAAFAALLMSLSFPVQFLVQTWKADLTPTVERLKKPRPGALGTYARSLAAYLERMGRGAVVTRRMFAVVFAGEEKGGVRSAAAEAERRVQTVLSGLARCGIPARQLSTQEVGELLYVMNNKERSAVMRYSDAGRFGYNSLYVGGKKEVRESVREKEAEVLRRTGRLERAV